MKKDAFYGRNSSEEQAEKGTIQAQVDFGKKFFELHEIDNYEMYLDEGVSGTIPLNNRPEGSRLIADIKAGKINRVWVYRLDRLARNVKNVLDTYDLLEKRSIPLKSMTEAFDTESPTGKFFMTLLASIAALERDTILDRTLMGKERNAKAGKWVSGAPPFGYRIGDEGKLEIHQPEAETIRLIFKLYSEGMSTVEVAKYLNAKQISTPSASKGSKNKSTGKWHAGHISIILRSEVYAGSYNYLKRSKRKKDTIEIEVPPIITTEQSTQAQQKIAENADVARGTRGRNYLLRSLIYCGHCGRAMIGSSGNSKKGRVYYRCTGTLDNGQGKICDLKMIRAVDIENAIWEDIKELIQQPEKFDQYIKKALEENKDNIEPLDQELAEIERNIEGKQGARGTVLSMLTRKIISEAEAEKSLKDLANEIDSLVSRREFLFEKKGLAQNIETETLNTQAILRILSENIDNLKEEDKARIIQGLVRRIEITNTLLDDNKRGCKAVMTYRFARCVELDIPRDSQTQTSLYSIESTWLFQAFSKKGGYRIRWR